MSDTKSSPTLADILRAAKKRPLIAPDNNDSKAAEPHSERWTTLARNISRFKNEKGTWPSDEIIKCLSSHEVPFSALADLLKMAVAERDIKLISALTSTPGELDDAALVEALLVVLHDKKSTGGDLGQAILKSIFRRRINQSLVVSKLKQSATNEEALSLLEAAAKLMREQSQVDEYNLYWPSVMEWVQAAIDSHFFGFAQRLGFSSNNTTASNDDNTNSSSNTGGDGGASPVKDELKTRLETVLDQLLLLADAQMREAQQYDQMLSLVEHSLALTNNRMPSASRYRDRNGKAHRVYAVRLISL